MVYRLAYSRSKEPDGVPWRIEHPNGECQYTASLVINAPARTVLTDGPGRYRGYLEVEGVLTYGRTQSRIDKDGDA